MFMSSFDLKLVYEIKDENTFPNRPIYLLCVFRDEELLLEYFIKYYQSLGVTHFIMIDNLSDDGGPEYIKQLTNINIKLYLANGSYQKAAYGTTWINSLLQKFCNNSYCFVVDIDELFYFDRKQFKDIDDVIFQMELENANVIAATLLDMYPKETNNGYRKGSDFLSHSPYFDKYNETYYHDNSVIYEKFRHQTGGVRERVLSTTVCINKFPFFKYDFEPLGVAAGYHFFEKEGTVLHSAEKINIFRYPSVLLHFKFIKPALDEFFQRRVALNQDWNNSSEYKSYVEIMNDETSIKFYDKLFSAKFVSNNSLSFFYIPLDQYST